MRILVCGSRDWTDYRLLARTLEDLGAEYTDFTLVHGGAKGADTMAGDWAQYRNIPVECFPAQWDRYGKRAGPIRNQHMLDSGIDLVIAFHDDLDRSKGTKHMVRIARKAGVPVRLIQHRTSLTIPG